MVGGGGVVDVGVVYYCGISGGVVVWWWCVAGIAVVCRRSSCEGSVAVVWVLVVLGVTPFLQKAVKSRKERWARLCLGRTLAGRGGPGRGDGTVRWAA